MEDQNKTHGETKPQAEGAGDRTFSKAEVDDLIQRSAQTVRDSVFAELRRNGLFDKGKQAEKVEAKPKQERGKDAGVSEDDVRGILARERSFARAVRGLDISESALSRMERAFEAEGPEDISEWVSEYANDFGFQQRGSSPPETKEEEPKSMDKPKTPGPNPAPAGMSGDQILDPYSMTEDDVDTLVRRHGTHKAGKMLMEALRKAPRKRLGIRRR